jgi:hypothetical protein
MPTGCSELFEIQTERLALALVCSVELGLTLDETVGSSLSIMRRSAGHNGFLVRLSLF